MNKIYHIVERSYWEENSNQKEYFSSNFEVENFIHSSIAEQLNATANRYYKAHQEIVVLIIDLSKLVSTIKFELSLSLQQDFPHIYGPINLDAVEEIAYCRKDKDDDWDFDYMIRHS